MNDTNEVTAIVPRTLNDASEMATRVCKAAILPGHLRNKPEDALAIILTGAELGIPPMQALRGFDDIQGKVTPKAELLGALVMRRSDVCLYLQCVLTTDKVATYETHRKGHPKPTSLSFTIEQAARGGATSKDNWKKHPEAMLRARALSAICRAVYPDVILGLHSTEEMGDELVESNAQAPASRTEGLKAKLKSKLEIVDEPVVSPEAKPSPPTEAIASKSPYELIEAACMAEGIAQAAVPEFAKVNTGKKTRASLTLADVDVVVAALEYRKASQVQP